MSCPPGNLPSLRISLTSDTLMAAFGRSNHMCVWQLDAQEMASFSADILSICPPHDGHRILVGGEDGIVRMWVIGYCMIILWKDGSNHIRAMC